MGEFPAGSLNVAGARRGHRGRSRAAVLGLAALLAFGCDLGGDSGCLRVSQGDYVFPDKRILSSSVAARITPSGLDFITGRIKALVLSFFDADASGRAIIPLSSLGVGTLSTSLGPFGGQVRDVVLTVDLSRLEVRLIPGTDPARLEIYIEDAEVGLVSGTLAGGINGTFFSGDAACGLANGPNGRVALLTMRLGLELGTENNGDLDVRVLPSSFDLQDFALTFETDCNKTECLDGLSPGSTSECLECETICPVADFGSSILSALRSALDGILDTLLDLLADEVANLVLNGFLNGRPLAIEGEIPLSSLLGPWLSWMQTARPLGFLARPAGQAFRVTGAGDGIGLDIVLNAGVDAPPHPCAPSPTAERIFGPGPRPTFDGVVTAPDGAIVGYDMALGVSDAVLNEALWALWRSGALCIRADSTDVAALTQGVVLTAQTLDLLLPGAAEVAGPNAAVRFVVRPRLDRGPDYVRFGRVVVPGQAEAAEPLILASLVEAEVAVEAQVGEGWVRLVGFSADLDLGLDLVPTADGAIEVRVGEVEIQRLSLPTNELFATARLDAIAPFVVELALGLLGNQDISFSLGLSGLGAGLGVPVEVFVAAMGPAGPEDDWLAIYLQFRDPPRTPRRLEAPGLEVWSSWSGGVEIALPGAAEGDRTQVRVGVAPWSRTLVGPGPHRLESAGLWLVGSWPLEVRALDEHGRAFRAERRGSFEVKALSPEAAPIPPLAPPTDGPSEPIGTTGAAPADEGCGGGLTPGCLMLLLLARRRR